MIDFKGQVIIVTGAGRGLGRCYALDIARRGGAVIVNDLGCDPTGEGADRSVADKVVDEIVGAGGVAVASYDSVATPEGGEAIVRLAQEQFGRVDAVINNAGIFGALPIDAVSPTAWRRMMSVHLDGAFYLTQPAFKIMKAQNYGRFVYVASSAGLFGQPSAAHYAAAKAGLLGLANVVAIEGGPHGILANTVLPFGATRMMTDAVGDLVAEVPFLRAQDPEKVPAIVTFLASRNCDLTHQVYSAGFGRFARVFVGLGEGWRSGPDGVPAAEDILANLARVAATDPYSVPSSILDEIETICRQLGIPFDLEALRPH